MPVLFWWGGGDGGGCEKLFLLKNVPGVTIPIIKNMFSFGQHPGR